MTSITLVRPASAPRVMMCDAPVRPRSRKARAMGASMLTSRHGTMPVRTAATAIYSSGANQQRSNDADGKIALRILRFLRGRGDGVESDVGEENVGCSGPDSGESEGRETVPVRSPVAGVDVANAEPDYKNDNGNFNGHDGGVEAGALFNANHQNRGDHQRDDEGGKVDSNFISETDAAHSADRELSATSSGDCAAMIADFCSRKA